MSNRPKRRPEPESYDDAWRSPEMVQWAAHVRHQVLPKLRQSALTISLYPKGDPDIKIAVELGMTLMLDKPLVFLVGPGQVVPDRLRRCADLIIEEDDPTKISEQLKAFLDERFPTERTNQ